MPKYLFCWTLSGSTIIEAATLAEAREQWDSLSASPVIYEDGSDFTEEVPLIEISPNEFVEAVE